MNNIYLVGFMGTGKTAVGRELARIKKWQFVDLDDLIELRQKMAISDIFAMHGEAHFRRIEKLILKEVAKEKNFIVACGGGIVIDPDNIETMRGSGMIICLSADVEAIFKRTQGKLHRPLLNVSEPRKQIELLLKLRAPYYARADKTLNTSKISIKQAAGKIMKLISSRAKAGQGKRKTKIKKKKVKR